MRWLVILALVFMLGYLYYHSHQEKQKDAIAEVVIPEKPEGGWLVSYVDALKEAKAKNNFVFIDFTGSDWCGWCIKLEDEVFSKTEFKEYADTNLVLLRVDFPQKKLQSAELKKQNQMLQTLYTIKGYPTIVVLDSEGVEAGRMGYQEGGPDAYVKALQKITHR